MTDSAYDGGDASGKKMIENRWWWTRIRKECGLSQGRGMTGVSGKRNLRRKQQACGFFQARCLLFRIWFGGFEAQVLFHGASSHF